MEKKIKFYYQVNLTKMMAMNDQHIYRHIKLHKKNIIGNHQIKNKNHFRSLRAYDTMYMYDI